MANVLIEENSLQDSANAIREMSGSTGKLKAAQFGDAIRGLKVRDGGATDLGGVIYGKGSETHAVDQSKAAEGQVLKMGSDGVPYWGEGGGGSSLTLKKIYISTPPKKTAYKAGETFDPTGMVIKGDYYLDSVPFKEGVELTGYTYPTGALAAGTNKVTITYTENATSLTVDQAITVTKTDVEVPTSTGARTYDGTEQTFTFNNEPSSSVATKSGDTAGTNVGGYTTRWTLNDTALYQWADGSTAAYKEVTTQINKVTPTVTAPTKATDMTYNGNDRDLTATAGSANYGTLEYSIDGTNWSTTRPTAKNAGSYTVRYRVVGDSNINDVASTSIGTVTIAQKEPTLTASPSSVTLDADNLTKTSAIVCDGDGTLSVESSDTSIATAQISGRNVTISHVNQTSGNATIKVKHTAKSGGNYATKEIEIAVEASFSKIYGASWDGTSTTKWTRTDAAAGFADPVPYVAGAASYGSPFDDISPWKDMTVVDDSAAGKLVKIPKFYYKLTQNGAGMSIQISMNKEDGFVCSPAHMDRGDGKGERDVVYIGRYHCATSTYKSTSGVKPQASVTRANFRTNIKNLGTGIYQADWAMRFTIFLLYLVEFADWNTQEKIGYGCGNGSATENMGASDSMPYHTGTMQSARTTYAVGVQYRNIEGLWDNVYDWVDGCYNASGGLMIILNPANFSDSANGVSVGTPSNGWPGAFTVKNVSGTFALFIPTATGGSGTTYSCDSWNFHASNPCVFAGGYYNNQNADLGLFYFNYSSVSNAYANRGSRLMKLP